VLQAQQGPIWSAAESSVGIYAFFNWRNCVGALMLLAAVMDLPEVREIEVSCSRC
jgi:hypothetical protein